MLKNINKRRNLLGTIYAIFMLMPLLSVLVTCIYVQFNHNAKDSYYGQTINEVQYIKATSTNVNTTYYLEWANLTSYQESPSVRLYVSNLKVEARGTMSDNVYNSLISNQDDVVELILTQYYNAPNIQFSTNIGGLGINLTSQQWIFSFNLHSYTGNFTISDLMYYEYNQYSYLDNAFDYSIYRVSNGNRGEIDFTSGLFNYFLSHNRQNDLYIGFVNYYINYSLLVSCVYFLYLILMWFITFIKNLIFKYMGD